MKSGLFQAEKEAHHPAKGQNEQADGFF